MEVISNNKRIQEIQLKSNLKLYINIRKDKEKEIEIYFDLQHKLEGNRSIKIKLTNFKDKKGKDIEAKILGVGLKNNENSKSYELTIDNKEVIKVQFQKKILIEDYDFDEINFDIIIDNDTYSFVWSYHNKILTKYIKNKKEME